MVRLKGYLVTLALTTGALCLAAVGNTEYDWQYDVTGVVLGFLNMGFAVWGLYQLAGEKR